MEQPAIVRLFKDGYCEFESNSLQGRVPSAVQPVVNAAMIVSAMISVRQDTMAIVADDSLRCPEIERLDSGAQSIRALGPKP